MDVQQARTEFAQLRQLHRQLARAEQRQQARGGQRFKVKAAGQQQDDGGKREAERVRHAVGGGPEEHRPQRHRRHADRIKQPAAHAGETAGQLARQHEQRSPGRHKTGQRVAKHEGVDRARQQQIRQADEQVHEHLVVGRQQVFQQRAHAVKAVGGKGVEQQALLGVIVDGVFAVQRLAVEHQGGDDGHAHGGAREQAAQESGVAAQAFAGEGDAPRIGKQPPQPARAKRPQQHDKQQPAVSRERAANQDGRQQRRAAGQHTHRRGPGRKSGGCPGTQALAAAGQSVKRKHIFSPILI